jgi:hypothetical protein
MDALLRFLVPFAQRQIDEHGGFRPFGASMAPDGELEALVGDDAVDVDQELDGVRALARERADGLLAVGICSDVGLDDGAYPGGIRVELEHRDADPITCILPYRNTDEELAWGEIVALPGERRTWAA